MDWRGDFLTSSHLSFLSFRSSLLLPRGLEIAACESFGWRIVKDESNHT